jgi:hypothetical protein
MDIAILERELVPTLDEMDHQINLSVRITSSLAILADGFFRFRNLYRMIPNDVWVHALSDDLLVASNVIFTQSQARVHELFVTRRKLVEIPQKDKQFIPTEFGNGRLHRRPV